MSNLPTTCDNCAIPFEYEWDSYLTDDGKNLCGECYDNTLGYGSPGDSAYPDKNESPWSPFDDTET